MRLEACDATVEAYAAIVKTQETTLRVMQRDIQTLKTQQRQRVHQRSKRPTPPKNAGGS